MTVSQRFDALISSLTLTDKQKEDGKARRDSVVEKLNRKYWNSGSTSANAKNVGSWGKATRVRPPRDVDVLFQLPKDVYDRFQARSGNKQSQLLQEVKQLLQSSYPKTDIRGDGPIVLVPFSSYNVEVIPAFHLQSGQYWICMTDNGGRYKIADYDAEIKALSESNDSTKNNTRDLIRMMKCWQAYCSVPIKSFWLELVVIDFLKQWAHAGKTSVYFDWMVRDFFAYLKDRKNSNVFAPGTNEVMYLGEAWASRADTAHGRASKACELESNDPGLAGDEWQKIFGADIPP